MGHPAGSSTLRSRPRAGLSTAASRARWPASGAAVPPAAAAVDARSAGDRRALASRDRGRTARAVAHAASRTSDRQRRALLLARMLYTDGMVAILAYVGIYASGTFSWDLAALLIFGAAMTPMAIVGGLVGGWVDNRFGSRAAILISVGATALGDAGGSLDHADPHPLHPVRRRCRRPGLVVPVFSYAAGTGLQASSCCSPRRAPPRSATAAQ